MNSSNGKPRYRAPGTVIHQGQTYFYVGKGSTVCTATYAAESNGKKLTLVYGELASITREFAVFRAHNNRLQKVAVSWKQVGDGMYNRDAVFLLGPISKHDENYLHAAAAWQCERCWN